MTRRLMTTLIALCTLAIASGSIVLAHEGHEHKVMGTVTMAAADHVLVKTTDGKDVTILVTKDTKVSNQTKAKDIQVGVDAKAAAK